MQIIKTIPDDLVKRVAARMGFQYDPANEPPIEDFQAAIQSWVDSNVDSHLVQLAKEDQLAIVQPQIDAILASVDTAVSIQLKGFISEPVLASPTKLI